MNRWFNMHIALSITWTTLSFQLSTNSLFHLQKIMFLPSATQEKQPLFMILLLPPFCWPPKKKKFPPPSSASQGMSTRHTLGTPKTGSITCLIYKPSLSTGILGAGFKKKNNRSQPWVPGREGCSSKLFRGPGLVDWSYPMRWKQLSK